MESTHPQSTNTTDPNNGTTTVDGNDIDDENHRRLFVELSFGPSRTQSNASETTSNKKTVMSVEEHRKFMQNLQYWNMPAGHIDRTTGQYISQFEFRRLLGKAWYETARSYRISTITRNGDIIGILERYDKGDKVWKRVVHEGDVYDAIKECHLKVNHRKVDETKTCAKKEYWNITEQLCRNYVRTCPECNKKGTNELETTNNMRSDRETNTICNRYCVSIIDFSGKMQKNIYGVEMRYILLVYDRDSNWTMLRPIPNLEERIIKNELLTLICIKGHHRFQGDHSIETATGTLTQRALSSLQIGNHSHEIFMLERNVYVTMQMLEQGNRDEVTDDANWVELLPYAMMYLNSSSKNYKKSLRKSNVTRRNTATDQATGDNVFDSPVDHQSNTQASQPILPLSDLPTKTPVDQLAATQVSQAMLPPSQPVLPLPDPTPFCQEQISQQIDT